MASRIPEGARKVFEGTIFTTWQWDQEVYDGSTQVFEGLSRPDYGTAVGVLGTGEVLLAWDEQPDRGPILSSVGGRIEAGESPEAGARREFIEETGYTPGRFIPWFSYQPESKVEYTVHMFIARDIGGAGEPALDPGEMIELRTFSFEDFLRLGGASSGDLGGPVRDWLLRVMLLEAQLDKTKRQALYSLLYE